MKFFFLFFSAMMVGFVNADWRSMISEEVKKSKKDDTVFSLIDRAILLEKNSNAVDKPFLEAYTSIVVLKNFRGFKYDKTSEPLNELATSASWTRNQVGKWLESRYPNLVKHISLYDSVSAEIIPYKEKNAKYFMPGNLQYVAGDISFLDLLVVAYEMANVETPELFDAGLLSAEKRGRQDIEILYLLRKAGNLYWENGFGKLEKLLTQKEWRGNAKALILFLLADSRIYANAAYEKNVAYLQEALSCVGELELKSAISERLERLTGSRMELSSLPALVACDGDSFRLRVRNLASMSVSLDDVDLKYSYVAMTNEVQGFSTVLVQIPSISNGTHNLVFAAKGHDGKEHKSSEKVIASSLSVARTALNPTTFFVVDRVSGNPVVGAEVSVTSKKFLSELDSGVEKAWEIHGRNVKTDELGLARFPSEYVNAFSILTLSVVHGKEKLEIPAERIYPHFRNAMKFEKQVQWFSDRTIYRPGETVKFQAIFLEYDLKSGRYLPKQKEEEIFVFAKSGEDLGRFAATDKLTKLFGKKMQSSENGSISGEVEIPQDFTGILEFKCGSNERNGGFSVTVAEFRAPNFIVDVKKVPQGIPVGKPLLFEGRVVSLLGLPLANSTVSWTIKQYGMRNENLDFSGKTVTDKDGKFSISHTFANKNNVSGILNVDVVDLNGERQSASCYFSQYLAGVELVLNDLSYLIEDEEFEIRITAERNVSGELVFYGKDDKNRISSTPMKRCDFSMPEPVKVDLPAGSYLLKGKIDSEQSEKDIATLQVLPRDGDTAVYGSPIVRVKLESRKAKIGETLDCYAGIPGKGMRFATIYNETGTVRTWRLTDAKFRVKIDESLKNGFSIGVYGFYNGDFVVATRTVEVEPPEELKITATNLVAETTPGAVQKWEFSVNHPEAEMVITVYDKSLDELVKNTWQSIRKMFGSGFHPDFNWFTALIRSKIRYSDQFEELDENDVEILVEEPGISTCALGFYGGRSNKSSSLEQKFRHDFSSTAFWAPQKQIRDGKAVFEFTLPDSLTTWKVMAFAFTKSGDSGTFIKECVAKKEIMLQPYMPRILRVGDNLSISVRVSNLTDSEVSRTVTLNDAQPKTVSVPANDSVIITWQIGAEKVGDMTFEFVTEGDALRLTVPVDDRKIRLDSSTPFSLVDTKPETYEIALPNAFDKFEIQSNDNPVSLIEKAVQSQLDYPYSCSEQIFAKIFALRVGKDFGFSVKGKSADDDLVSRLIEMCKADGLWPWFEGMQADSEITAEICIGVSRLHLLGLTDEKLSRQVLKILSENRSKISVAAWLYARTAHADFEPINENLLPVITEALKNAKTVQERRLIACAALRLNLKTIAKKAMDELHASMNENVTWGVYWPRETGWWLWWSSPIESHVLGLEMLVLNGEKKRASQAAEWLLQNKRMNEWGSTRATSAALFGLRFAGLKSENKPVEIKQIRKSIPNGEKVTLTRSIPGFSFGSIQASCMADLSEIKASKSDGLRISRSVYPEKVKLGETITVTLILHSDQPIERIHVRDQRPANTEPVNVMPWFDYGSGGLLWPGDRSVDLFIRTLPRGDTTIRYRLKASHAGDCTSGLATIESMYVPEFRAHASTYSMEITADTP